MRGERREERGETGEEEEVEGRERLHARGSSWWERVGEGECSRQQDRKRM